MKVKDLIERLSQFDGDADIVIGSGYVDDIGSIKPETISAFWGKDFEAVVIYRGNQLGKIEF